MKGKYDFLNILRPKGSPNSGDAEFVPKYLHLNKDLSAPVLIVGYDPLQDVDYSVFQTLENDATVNGEDVPLKSDASSDHSSVENVENHYISIDDIKDDGGSKNSKEDVNAEESKNTTGSSENDLTAKVNEEIAAKEKEKKSSSKSKSDSVWARDFAYYQKINSNLVNMLFIF